MLTRRGFAKAAGGGLIVSLGIPVSAADGSVALDPSRLDAWLEIRADNTIVARTGRGETGTGMSGFYPQVVAEELNVRPEMVRLIMGDTDCTPDGGYSSGFLTGAANLRKVAAYAYQKLLELAAEHLQVPLARLSTADGLISDGGSRTVTYGELVQGRQLAVTIPLKGVPLRFAAAGKDSVAGLAWAGMEGLTVTGEPPLKPIPDYKVVGKSFPMPGIPAKVTGETIWSCDLTLPGMLHARMIRPTSLGSTLISVGKLDKAKFPMAQVVRKGNLLAVLSTNEWEAVTAAKAVAATTKWSDWSGLPGSDNLTRELREHQWGPPDASKGNEAEVQSALAEATHTISASFEQPYVKHAPIGPFVAVADVRSDGTATVWSQIGHLQASRVRLANLLGTPPEKVVVRWLDHAGQFGRKTFGGDGAEADAVILSLITGRPVRVQWSMEEDFAWSSLSPAWFADVKGGLDGSGRLTAVQSAFHSPHMFDARPVGAILAGMPSGTVKRGGFLDTEWPYDRVQHRLQQVYAMDNLASESPYGGLRGLIMRTPGQRQQNFVQESLVNEAASVAKADPIQFRLDHTTDQRLIEVIKAVAKDADWQPRPSPNREARRTGSDPVMGRGVSVIVRSNAYWVGLAEIAVTPSTGLIRVTSFTVGVECGKIINPRQLDRCIKGGIVMGVGEALKEEVTFDHARITSTDWNRYRILTMQETPDIRVLAISRDDQGFGTGGEAPNALGPPAIAAALFDATGVFPRRIPLTPRYVQGILAER
ncbi:MAG TPA: molybdopterin cofactor-binding domain-containing protein [Bryobacteraceae bacterium]|nr:molybdopterin cofactor-binding domain-containing protein [Bryobacteraceae bacterium]